MKGLKKVVQPSKVILDDIWLSFYPGAKIGVLGGNGAGKSSLLRIMAGVDTEFQGEAWAHKGTKIGYLPQEPELDPTLDVRGNVEVAVKAQRELLNRFNEISTAFGEPMDDAAMDKLLAEQARVQEQIDTLDTDAVVAAGQVVVVEYLAHLAAGRYREAAPRRRRHVPLRR